MREIGGRETDGGRRRGKKRRRRHKSTFNSLMNSNELDESSTPFPPFSNTAEENADKNGGIFCNTHKLSLSCQSPPICPSSRPFSQHFSDKNISHRRHSLKWERKGEQILERNKISFQRGILYLRRQRLR